MKRVVSRKEYSLSYLISVYQSLHSFSALSEAYLPVILPRVRVRATPRLASYRSAIHRIGPQHHTRAFVTPITKFFKMSDDEADPELLALLRQHLQGKLNLDEEPETGVLEGAEYVYDNSIDVALDMRATKNAAAFIHNQMQKKQYSTETWAEHELHPKTKDEASIAFIFTMDLLNFSFWSLRPESERFAVSYRDKTWTGYWSLVASLQRALEEGRCMGAGWSWKNFEPPCHITLLLSTRSSRIVKDGLC